MDSDSEDDDSDEDSEEDTEDSDPEEDVEPEPNRLPRCKTRDQHDHDTSIDERINRLKSECQWGLMDPAARAAARAAAVTSAKKRIRRSLGLPLTASDATVGKAWRKVSMGLSWRQIIKNRDYPTSIRGYGHSKGFWLTQRMFLLESGVRRSDPTLSVREGIYEATLFGIMEQDGEARQLRDQAAVFADDIDKAVGGSLVAEAIGGFLAMDGEAGGGLIAMDNEAGGNGWTAPAAVIDGDGEEVVVNGVQNGPVPVRGGNTTGAPPTTTAKSQKRPIRKKRSIRTSGSMAPELLEKYQQWHLLIPGRKHVGELQFPYPENRHFSAYVNIGKIMDADAFYTDSTSCAMDAFNLGVGRPVLNRQTINSPFDPDKGVSYGTMEPAIEAAGFAMRMVASGTKKKRVVPKMIQILGLVSGVFFVEFFWMNKDGDRDFHVVAVNCDQRRVFCNTLGVIPFATGKKNESAATHARVVADLKVVNAHRVYRIVRSVQDLGT